MNEKPDASMETEQTSNPDDLPRLYDAKQRLRKYLVIMGAFLGFFLLLGAFLLRQFIIEEKKHLCQLRMKQIGLGLQLFCRDNGEYYPQLFTEPGQLALLNQSNDYNKPLYPEYINDFHLFRCPMPQSCRPLISYDPEDPQQAFNDSSYLYLGYTVTNDTEMEAFAAVYRERVSAGLSFDEDLTVPEGMGNLEQNKLYRLREGVERFLIWDINGPGRSQRIPSSVPVLIERFGDHRNPAGAHVLYLDHRVEFIPYPGQWPMTKKTLAILQSIEAMKTNK